MRWGAMGSASSFQSLKSPITDTARGIGRPDGERHAADAVALGQVRAEFFVVPEVRALREKVEIVIGHEGRPHFSHR